MTYSQINTNSFETNITFFRWLFESSSISLNSEIDKIPSVENAEIIYYPDELKSFFETNAMQRLKRLLQLSKFIDNDSNVLHTRYEHSLGTYNKKKNLIIEHYFKNPILKKYIEDNNLKIFLIAELIKSSAHDIGHLPLSHVLELSFFEKNGLHEEIGHRILQEDSEISHCLSTINPELPNALNQVLTQDFFGFNLLDGGNYDIDRFDYLYRDLAFRGQPHTANFEPFKFVRVKSSIENGIKKPITDLDSSIITTNFEDTANSMLIPVFNISSLEKITNFQRLRIKCYHECYYNPINAIRDKSIALVINKMINTNEPYGIKLQSFLKNLKTEKDISKLDINSFLYWDDLTFYNELLDVAEFSSNDNLRTGARFVVPGLEQLFDMSTKMLSLKKQAHSLSEFDKKFLKRLHRYLTTKTDFTKDISDFNYWDKCIAYTTDYSKIEQLKKNKTIPAIYYSQEISGYKTKYPLYFKTKQNKIYSYENLPSKPNSTKIAHEQEQVAFCFLPFLDRNIFDENAVKNMFDNPQRHKFGTPYFNRPSPSGIYIKDCYVEER